MSATYKDIGVSSEGHVGIVEIQRPPHNFFDNSLINQIADAFEAFDRDNDIRAYVLCAQGKSFCAGADFANRPQTDSAESGKHLYKEATRLFRAKKPSIAAVQAASKLVPPSRSILPARWRSRRCSAVSTKRGTA